MLPAMACSPPNSFRPRRWLFESRPLRDEPPAFLCAMASIPSVRGYLAQLCDEIITFFGDETSFRDGYRGGAPPPQRLPAEDYSASASTATLAGLRSRLGGAALEGLAPPVRISVIC